MLKIFTFVFVAGNFPLSEFFRRSSFQTFMIEKGVYLLVDWFYNRRRSTIDHLDIYKHIYHASCRIFNICEILLASQTCISLYHVADNTNEETLQNISNGAQKHGLLLLKV